MPDSDAPVQAEQTGPWDPLALALRDLRARRGDPSYAEIARLVMQRRGGRDANGVGVARTTVYDVFRLGRTRVNLELVREIARALGADDAEVDSWVAQCRWPPQQPPAPAAPAPTPAVEAGPTSRQAVGLMVLGVVINLLGRFFVDVFHLPIFLDMIGTAFVAIALGPWRGAAVGVATNALGVLSSGPESLVFLPVNVVGALVWGYGVRRLGLGRTHLRFLALHVLVALACSAVAVPLLLVVFHSSVGHGEDVIASTVLQLTGLNAVAVAVSNVLVSIADKLLSGFIALTVLSACDPPFRRAIRWLLPDQPESV